MGVVYFRKALGKGKVSKTPGTETFRLHGRDFSEKLAEKVNGKGGYKVSVTRVIEPFPYAFSKL